MVQYCTFETHIFKKCESEVVLFEHSEPLLCSQMCSYHTDPSTCHSGLQPSATVHINISLISTNNWKWVCLNLPYIQNGSNWSYFEMSQYFTTEQVGVGKRLCVNFPERAMLLYPWGRHYTWIPQQDQKSEIASSRSKVKALGIFKARLDTD